MKESWDELRDVLSWKESWDEDWDNWSEKVVEESWDEDWDDWPDKEEKESWDEESDDWSRKEVKESATVQQRSVCVPSSTAKVAGSGVCVVVSTVTSRRSSVCVLCSLTKAVQPRAFITAPAGDRLMWGPPPILFLLLTARCRSSVAAATRAQATRAAPFIAVDLRFTVDWYLPTVYITGIYCLTFTLMRMYTLGH